MTEWGRSTKWHQSDFSPAVRYQFLCAIKIYWVFWRWTESVSSVGDQHWTVEQTSNRFKPSIWSTTAFHLRRDHQWVCMIASQNSQPFNSHYHRAHPTPPLSKIQLKLLATRLLSLSYTLHKHNPINYMCQFFPESHFVRPGTKTLFKYITFQWWCFNEHHIHPFHTSLWLLLSTLNLCTWVPFSLHYTYVICYMLYVNWITVASRIPHTTTIDVSLCRGVCTRDNIFLTSLSKLHPSSELSYYNYKKTELL